MDALLSTGFRCEIPGSMESDICTLTSSHLGSVCLALLQLREIARASLHVARKLLIRKKLWQTKSSRV